MTTYMHCRPCYGTSITICLSTFPVGGSTYPPGSYHHQDQIPSESISSPRRRRRLEDPIITYASNYYATLPGQMSQGSKSSPISQPSPPPPLPPPPRQIYRQSERNGAYCDLYNLLELPTATGSSGTKQRRKYPSNDLNSRRSRRLSNSNERKRRYQATSSCKDKKRPDEKHSSTERYNYSCEKSKKMNEIYQQRSSNKGFFRRVVRHYFCMPAALSTNGYSS